MDDSAREWLVPLARTIDFSRISTLVDVGGGHGTFLAAVLQANPSMRGVLFDLPHVVQDAPAVLAAAGVSDRCTVVAGDMRLGVPPGGDAYRFTRVLFNWPDDIVCDVLRHCRAVLADHGSVVIVESLMSEGIPAAGLAMDDLGLLVSIGGCQRTEQEFRALLAAAGFTHRECTRHGRNHVLWATHPAHGCGDFTECGCVRRTRADLAREDLQDRWVVYSRPVVHNFRSLRSSPGAAYER